MTLPASDAFTTGANANLTSYSANWTMAQGAASTLQVLAASDDVYPNNGGNEMGAFWNADSFNNDQYSEARISAQAGHFIGVCVRAATGGNYYGWYAANYSTSGYLFKMVSGSWTQLGSTAGQFAVSDIVRIEAEGTTITPYVDGSSTGTPGAQTDSSLSSGAAGLCGYDSGSGTRIDDWEGGNLGSSPITGTVNQISETDLAQAVTRLKNKLLGQNSETDSAQAISAARLYALAQASETDAVQAFAMSKAKAVGQNAEADAAQVITPQRVYTVGQVSETNNAQAISAAKAGTVGQASETDSVQAIARSKQKAIGQAEETDSALSLGTQIVGTVNQVTETDAAQAIARIKQKATEQNAEADSAQTITPAHVYDVGQVVETDSTFQFTITKIVDMGQVTETDSALSLGTVIVEQVGQVVETDEALSITARKVLAVSPVAETNLTQALFPLKRVAVTQAVETDSSISISKLGTIFVSIGQVFETDSARPILAGPFFGIATMSDSLIDAAIVSDYALWSAGLSDMLMDDASLEIKPL